MNIANVMASMGLQAQKSMIPKMNNNSVIDLGNDWSDSESTHHIDVHHNSPRELKEEMIVSDDKNNTDMHTKNLAGPLFEKHRRVYIVEDETNATHLTCPRWRVLEGKVEPMCSYG